MAAKGRWHRGGRSWLRHRREVDYGGAYEGRHLAGTSLSAASLKRGDGNSIALEATGPSTDCSAER